jgi:oligoribonuclease NrnB/cAMP/cGMP phosphodiesterase (DHH superfamily)
MQSCLYHRSDLDGHCSGAICALKFKDIKLHGIEYGDDVPWELIDGFDLIVVDWSFQPWSLFEEVISRANTVTWIDHHKSAIEEYEKSSRQFPNLKVFLNTELAACELAWDYFFPNKDKPLAVRLLGRYDVWDHSDGRVLPFHYRVKVEKTDPDTMQFWHKIFNKTDFTIKDYIYEGEIILKYEKQQNKKSIEAIGCNVVFEGKLWLAANRTGINSKFFDTAYDPDKYFGVISWGWTGKHWRVSLYTTHDHVDCSAICKSYGGGGHKNAAGFQCKELPFKL